MRALGKFIWVIVKWSIMLVALCYGSFVVFDTPTIGAVVFFWVVVFTIAMNLIKMGVRWIIREAKRIEAEDEAREF